MSGELRWVALIGCLTIASLFGGTLTCRAADADENQPDVRLHRLLYERTDAFGRSYPHMVDPPLWPDTKWLLTGEPHRTLLKLFDELAQADVRQASWHARRRALAQREVRQVFDWTFGRNDDDAARDAIRKNAVAALKRLALTPEEIAALPTSLRTARGTDAPPNVLDADAGWVVMQLQDDKHYAIDHRGRFGPRSTFTAFFRHPDGRKATEAYFKLLAETDFPPKKAEASGGFFDHRGIPAFPVGTQVALLRTAVLLDMAGRAVASPLIESLQVRTFLKIDDPTKQDQIRVEEHALDHASYLTDREPRLHAVGLDDDEPLIFRSHGHDTYESSDRKTIYPTVLRHCAACHRDIGAASLLGFTGALSEKREKNPRIRAGTLEDELKRSLRLHGEDEKTRAAKLHELWKAT